MSSSDQSIAPKERINITYKPATGDQTAQVELPHRSLVLGDFTGRSDERALEERKPIDINKDNFDSVLAAHDVRFEASLPDSVRGAGEMAVSLSMRRIRDFEPEAVARQVPELRQLLELREALTALKAPLANQRDFKRALEDVISNAESRNALLRELGIEPSDEG